MWHDTSTKNSQKTRMLFRWKESKTTRGSCGNINWKQVRTIIKNDIFGGKLLYYSKAQNVSTLLWPFKPSEDLNQVCFCRLKLCRAMGFCEVCFCLCLPMYFNVQILKSHSQYNLNDVMSANLEHIKKDVLLLNLKVGTAATN